MQIKAFLTRKDLVLLNLYVFLRLKSTWVLFFALWAGFVVFEIFSDGMPDSNNELLLLVVSYGIGAMVGIFGLLIWCVLWILITANKKSGVLGEHEYRIEEHGLFEQTDANETLTKWRSIVSIWKTRMFILVRVNSYLFHIIPKNAFGTSKEFTEFYDELVAKWKGTLS
ncbi:MAG TPA: YcxB family protein [Gammaproteobacteria bacterium]